MIPYVAGKMSFSLRQHVLLICGRSSLWSKNKAASRPPHSKWVGTNPPHPPKTMKQEHSFPCRNNKQAVLNFLLQGGDGLWIQGWGGWV